MEEAEPELQKHQAAHDDINEKILELERQIGDWLNGHPTFRDELEFVDTTPNADEPTPGSLRFDELGERDEIGDEWSCVFKFGYLKGLIEAHATVDMRTGVPYDQFDTKEE